MRFVSVTKLTVKQEQFCREYIIDLNATQAAIRAGYSEKTARSTSAEYLAKPHIQGFIQELMDKRIKSNELDSDYVLKRLKEIDELDIIDIMQDDLSGFRPLSEWPKSWRISISGIDINTIILNGHEPVETLVKKIKWPDKTKNLELIGRHTKVKAWDKDEVKPQDQNITINFTDAVKPEDD